MNKDDLREFVEKNWYVIAAVAVLAIMAVSVLWPSGDGTPPGPGDVGETTTGDGGRPAAPVLQNATRRLTTEERAQKTIDEHLATIEAKPDDPDTPALLLAIATLYKTQKRDYKQAATYYERILREYPSWESIGAVFPDLEVCFKEIGDTGGLKWLYQEWMRRMPSDSQEYLYAEKALSQQP